MSRAHAIGLHDKLRADVLSERCFIACAAPRGSQKLVSARKQSEGFAAASLLIEAPTGWGVYRPAMIGTTREPLSSGAFPAPVIAAAILPATVAAAALTGSFARCA